MYPYCDTHKYVIYLCISFLQEETPKETPSKSVDKQVCLCVMCDITYYMYTIYMIILYIYICTQYVTQKC